MQIIARIESVADDLIPRLDPKTREISSYRGVLTTFKPTGVFEFSVDKDFFKAGLVEDLKGFEGQKALYSLALIDMTFSDGSRYKTWSLRMLPESLDSINEVKKVGTFPAPSSSPAPQVSEKKFGDK